MTESKTSSTTTQQARSGLHRIGTDAAAAEARPVRAQDRAVIGVFADIDSAEAAVERLIAAGFPANQLSIVAKDLQSEIHINGFVTSGEIAGRSAATGAWVGGLFGVLAGTALLFVPGAGPLIVLGPLAAAAVGAAEGALVAGGLGAILGHFVEERHIPKYEELVRAGDYLLVAYGTEPDVQRAEQILNDTVATDVQRHDRHRSDPGPIADVREGMRVVDAAGNEVGRVTVVKMGDPGAVTTQGQILLNEPSLEAEKPHLPPELSERLLRIGYIKVDRKGLFRSDVYAGADQIAKVDGDTVHLAVDQHLLFSEA
jgi:hypothetical protein